MYLPI
jgi:hypothetical protein